jgi:hypothetical protein
MVIVHQALDRVAREAVDVHRHGSDDTGNTVIVVEHDLDVIAGARRPDRSVPRLIGSI